MKTQKSKYDKPEIVSVLLDNQISLILLSDAPFGPDELSMGGSSGF
jgi:hypothetical protein